MDSRENSELQVSHEECLSICLFCSCSSQYEDIIVQENVLMHLCDTILAKDGSNLQQHVSFSQKPTLSKYYHVIQVSYQKSGYV